MSSEIAIRVENLAKCYEMYDRPRDRLWQMLSRGSKKYYREFWALKEVAFEIKKGDTVGVIGRNGSGKSTLLQLLCGTLNPTKGSIEINGKVAALLELGAGFNPEFTGRENVFLSASLYGLTREAIVERFDQIVEFADIGDFVDQPVKTYSSGMFVRLAFAVIAHVDADILVIDEALAVGDAFFVQKCMRFLRKFTEHGTLFFVSHDTSAIVGICSKALLMDRGELKCAGDPKDVSEFYLAMLHNDKHEALPSKKSSDLQPSSRNDFGSGLAKIISVDLLDGFGEDISQIVGGEYVRLKVAVLVESTLTQAIVGFLVRDRLGQIVFGENTSQNYGEAGFCIKARKTEEVCFEFFMPILQSGDYSVTVAIAKGTQADHVQYHWVHDALIIHARPERIYSGVISVPMSKITFTGNLND